jgi:hypothetical protein
MLTSCARCENAAFDGTLKESRAWFAEHRAIVHGETETATVAGSILDAEAPSLTTGRPGERRQAWRCTLELRHGCRAIRRKSTGHSAASLAGF